MKLTISLAFMFLSASISFLNAQSISLINNPNPYDFGFSNLLQDSFKVINGKLYGSYTVDNSNHQLAEFNGTSTTLIPNPNSADPGIFSGFLGYGNNLYFTYTNSSYKYQLAKYNGTNISLIPNINSTDEGFSTNEMIVFQGELFSRYRNSAGKYQLARYDGTNLAFIPNPNTSDVGIGGSFLEYNNKLYFIYTDAGFKNHLAMYDGTSVTVFSNLNNNDVGVSNLFISNATLYFLYQKTNNLTSPPATTGYLGKFTGTAISVINNPDNSTSGVSSSLKGANAWYNGALYFPYQSTITNENKLAKYDGTSITLIPNPPSSYGPVGGFIVFNNFLYCQFINSTSQYLLAKYDGTTISLIPNPNSTSNYYGQPIVYNNVLYGTFGINNTSQETALGYLNGNSISFVTNTNSPYIGYNRNPIIYNNKLYFKYLFGTPPSDERNNGTHKTSVNPNPWPDNNSQIGLLVLPPCTPTTSDSTAAVCNKFTWHDSTYKASTDAVWHTTNAAGCDSARTLHLTILSVTSTTTQTDANCYGTKTGSITVTPTYGVSPFTYRIGTVAGYVSTNTFNNLRAGKYTVSILDANGCAGITSQVTITQPVAVTASASSTPATCFGGATGSITVTPSTGTSPYMYRLGITGTFGSSNVFSSVKGGNYIVYLKDANSCAGYTTVNVLQPTKLSATSTKTNESCPNSKNGSVTITPSGATPPYTYRFGSTGSFVTNNTFSNLAAGSYRIYVNDANNCSGYSILTTVGQTSPTCGVSTFARGVANNNMSEGLNLSPNPSNTQFKLILPTTDKAATVRIFDMNGRVLYTTKTGNQSITFGENFAPGVYMVEVRQGESVRTLKAVKN